MLMGIPRGLNGVALARQLGDLTTPSGASNGVTPGLTASQASAPTTLLTRVSADAPTARPILTATSQAGPNTQAATMGTNLISQLQPSATQVAAQAVAKSQSVAQKAAPTPTPTGVKAIVTTGPNDGHPTVVVYGTAPAGYSAILKPTGTKQAGTTAIIYYSVGLARGGVGGAFKLVDSSVNLKPGSIYKLMLLVGKSEREITNGAIRPSFGSGATGLRPPAAQPTTQPAPQPAPVTQPAPQPAPVQPQEAYGAYTDAFPGTPTWGGAVAPSPPPTVAAPQSVSSAVQDATQSGAAAPSVQVAVAPSEALTPASQAASQVSPGGASEIIAQAQPQVSAQAAPAAANGSSAPMATNGSSVPAVVVVSQPSAPAAKTPWGLIVVGVLGVVAAGAAVYFATRKSRGLGCACA